MTPRRALLLPLALLLASCAAPRPSTTPGQPESPPPRNKAQLLIRVGIAVAVDEAAIGTSSPATIRAGEKTIAQAQPGDSFWVRADGTGVSLYGRDGLLASRLPRVRFVLENEHGELTVNSVGYPQGLEVYPSSRGGLNVVNEVDLETYLKGVVPREIAHKSSEFLEAAKAQAVAARTYTVAHLHQYPQEGFDIEAGVQDQVYSGTSGRHPSADRAVAETAGLVLIYDGRPIQANYASTCGGRTASAEESFETAPIPYLKSREDRLNGEPSCRTSKYYRWETAWTADELTATLSRTIPAVLKQSWRGTSIREVKVMERGPSGRAVRLRIQTDETVYDVSKGAIRRVLERAGGQGLLWSAAFELEAATRAGRITRLTARGQGWGHGVGMCQWGAMQLSREGRSFREILRHYYPGTELVRWTEDGRADAH